MPNIRVTQAAVPGTAADNDLVRRGPSGALYIWSSRGFANLAGVREAGQEASGREGDPRFGDSSAYPLLTSSPAIDAGNPDVVGHADVDRFGRARVGPPDLGALEASPEPAAPRLVRTVRTSTRSVVAWVPEPSAFAAAHEVLIDGRKVAEASAGSTSATIPASVAGRVTVRTVIGPAVSAPRAAVTDAL